MSTTCDSCKQIVDQEDGFAHLNIQNPMPDFRADVPYVPRRTPPQIDICAGCLVKLIAALGLPEDTFTPRAKSPTPTDPIGALTSDDLVALGLEG